MSFEVWSFTFWWFRFATEEADGKRKAIHDVYYVPGLMCNLLSVGQLLVK